MFNKNDPLISAVQEVMKRNHAEREAAKVVNEKFGVTDRKALPHEKQGAWDAAYKQVLSEGVEALDEMSEKQKKLAKVGNKAGLGGSPTKIDAPDLEGARKGHAKHIEEEQIDEVLDTSKKRMDYGMKAIGSYIKASLTGDKNTKRKRLAGNKNYKKKVAQAGEKRAMDSYREKKSGEVLRGMGRKTGLGQHYDKIFKEEHLNEKSPPGRADQVEALKKKFPDDRAFRIAWSSYNKSKKKNIDEGFNNRHSLSENASAEKQAVAVLNEQENPIVAQRKKYAAKRKQAAADKKTTERIKAREPREPTSFERFQAREKQSPTKVIGGSPIVPIGGPAASLAKTAIRNAPGILSRAYNYFRGGSSSQQPTLAAGAARRPPGQTVPQIRQQSPSSGSNLPTGPWGSIARSPRRGGDARAAAGKDTRGAPSGTMMARLRQQGQQVQQGRAGGSTVAATQAASRTRLAQQTQQGRVGTNTTGATQAAARTSLAQRIKGMRAGGATAGARRVPQTAFANEVPGISTTPNAAQADSGPEKIKTSTQTTTTQPDYDKMTFGQAFKTARQQAGGAAGKFKYKGKEYQTNVQGTGTTKKPQEKYQPASKLKTVAPAPETKTTTSVVGGQGVAAVPGGTSTAAAKPASSAAKERTNFAGPPSGTSSLTRRVGPDGQGGIKVGQDKPMGMSFRPQTTVDAAKKPAASVTPQMSQSVSSLQQKASMAGKERGLAPRFAERELTRRQNIQTVKGA